MVHSQVTKLVKLANLSNRHQNLSHAVDWAFLVHLSSFLLCFASLWFVMKINEKSYK